MQRTHRTLTTPSPRALSSGLGLNRHEVVLNAIRGSRHKWLLRDAAVDKKPRLSVRLRAVDVKMKTDLRLLDAGKMWREGEGEGGVPKVVVPQIYPRI